MVRWKMYSDIHHFKDIGLNKTPVANRLNLNYKTVRKYWDVTPDEFLEIQKSRKARKLDKYHAYLDLVKTVPRYKHCSNT
ncbi:integrase [Alkalicella caledoniensis]|uniref:Integrase n=1 Tax=Alkalicella caledoniensis TaxID=2731377 RepID=A0A7G9WA38_ALKCA|nr:integrase [Alkalicella caledoniensis]QNO15550.1 integrase [Alkalicella caledoniensis]